jgi:hypothetical protein
MWRRHRHDGAAFLAVAIFPIGGAAVVYPSMHYLVIPAACVLLAAVLAIAIVLPEPGLGASRWRRGVVALLSVAAIPTPFVVPTRYFVPTRAPIGSVGVTRPVTDAVHVIRALDLPRPVRVLTFADGLGELAGEGFTEIKIWQRGERSLRAYLDDAHVDVIVTLEPGRQSFRIDDPYWEALQNDPAAAGFALVATPPGTTARIWVRADRMRPAPSR